MNDDLPQNSTPRGPFEGVARIATYNWPFYAFALVGCALALPITGALQTRGWRKLAALGRLGASAGAFWTLSSLLVSHLVYDRSTLYGFQWLSPLLPPRPREITVLHAGLDECSRAIEVLFPDANVQSLDFFSALEMTEPSISRARELEARAGRVSPPVDYGALPVDTASQDGVILMLAAHELRAVASRDAFFAELSRVLAPNGRLIIVEHVRDAANFGAFGPGFMHFFPVSEWERLGRAHFGRATRLRLTPWLRVWSWSHEV